MTLSLSRRAFALGLPTTALILGALPRVAGATAASAPTDAVTPLAQISIGRFTVTALSDGYGDMPFGYFPGRTAEQVEARAQFAARPTGIRFVFNQYLVKDASVAS